MWQHGTRSANVLSRAQALAPESLPSDRAPWQARRMDRQDVADRHRWHRAAVERAVIPGFDVVYVYAVPHRPSCVCRV